MPRGAQDHLAHRATLQGVWRMIFVQQTYYHRHECPDSNEKIVLTLKVEQGAYFLARPICVHTGAELWWDAGGRQVIRTGKDAEVENAPHA